VTRPVALALSPHLDDAAFSCGGTLAGLARRGWRVVIATVFTRSVPHPTGFALACQLDKGLGPEVDYMALRRDEDGAALAALGAEPRWLDLEEAPHRGYGSAPELFGSVRDDDPTAGLLPPVLRDVIAEVRPDLLLAPQAIGGHVDHVQVVRALSSLDAGVPITSWEDFPYLVREDHPKQPFGPRFAALPEQVNGLTLEDVAAKRASCLAYRSQLGFQFGGPAGLDERLGRAGATERFRGAPLP
jgi:LmbE family N-acetylglucosaminyl deacetylase